MVSSESALETEFGPAVGTGVMDAGNTAHHNAAVVVVVAAAGVEVGGGVNGVGDDAPLQTGAARPEAAGDAGTLGSPGWDTSQTCRESYIPWASKIPPAAAAAQDFPLPKTAAQRSEVAGTVPYCHLLGTVQGPGSGAEAAVVVSHSGSPVSGVTRGAGRAPSPGCTETGPTDTQTPCCLVVDGCSNEDKRKREGGCLAGCSHLQ